jgi:hypothetical protein
MQTIDPYDSCDQAGYMFSRASGIFNVFIGRDTILYVNGGVPPYTWSITGNDFDLDKTVTTVQYNLVRANANTVVRESAEEITVTDSCGNEATFFVQCCSTYTCCEEFADVFTVDDIDSFGDAGYKIIKVYTGCPPFSWISEDLSKAYFKSRYTNSRTNILYYAIDEPYGCAYNVTDSCGNVANGSITYPDWFFPNNCGMWDGYNLPDPGFELTTGADDYTYWNFNPHNVGKAYDFNSNGWVDCYKDGNIEPFCPGLGQFIIFYVSDGSQITIRAKLKRTGWYNFYGFRFSLFICNESGSIIQTMRLGKAFTSISTSWTYYDFVFDVSNPDAYGAWFSFENYNSINVGVTISVGNISISKSRF